MRFLSTVCLASGAMAAVVGRNTEDLDCVLSNYREMAADANCGSADDLKTCFSGLDSPSVEQLVECYKMAGCGNDNALSNALSAQERCEELFGGVELRKRSPVEMDAPQITAMDLDDLFPNAGHHLFPRSRIQGDDCMSTGSKQTKVCTTATEGGDEDCTTTTIATSKCKDSLTCTRDGQGEHVCMELKDNLDIAGIIVAIVMSVGAVAGVVTITFLCIQNKKEQKRLTAKAEATALARAATKKKRAAEQRTPLMAQQQAGARTTPGGDPFADRNRS